MAKINVYLNFDGTTEEAFKFYQSVFGGEFKNLMRFKESPGSENIAAPYREKLSHVSLQVSSNLVLHGTDFVPGMGMDYKPGNNFTLLIEPESKAEADKFFNLLSPGGKVQMPMKDEFFGYYGSFTDRYGVQWMINFMKQ